MKYLLKFASILSLSTVHRLGAWIGCLIFLCSARARKRTKQNLTFSQLAKDQADFKRLCRESMQAFGQSIVETLAVWGKHETELVGYVKQVDGWEHVETALARGKGLILLTPHLGCFEVSPIYFCQQHPITVLFRAPKLTFLREMTKHARARKGITLAEANANGVRKLMQALKRGEAIGILPDQVPSKGEGAWANFFGQPAYTMTLASKIATKTHASIIMTFCERLPNGEGYHIHLTPVESIATPDLLNAVIEKQIAQKPAQYLWSYNRFKRRSYALEKEGAPTSNIS